MGTEGGKTTRTSREKATERGVIRRSQEARGVVPERRGKGSEERRRETSNKCLVFPVKFNGSLQPEQKI